MQPVPLHVTKVWFKTADVRRRCAELHPTLTPEILAESVAYGMAHRKDCTSNDPLTGPGFIAWDKTIRRFRDLTAPANWTAKNHRNVPITVAPSGSFAITASSGNEYTGLKDATPQLQVKHPKGAAMGDLIPVGQSSFLHLCPAPEPTDDLPTWLLMYHFDEESGTWRAELSLPMSLNRSGYVSGWIERILLPIDAEGVIYEYFGDAGDSPDNDGADEIVIEVERRAIAS